MAASNSPVYLVDADADPVLVKICGRASFLNSQLIRDFLQQSIRDGKRHFAVDFSECTGMDSTFLGVLAGTALELRKAVPSGSFVFCRLGSRNLELVRNLGLHRLATVDSGAALPSKGASESTALEGPKQGDIENARLCLEAHESLVEADEANRRKFQDVITFLKGRVQQD
ncbi:MAG TPA: STAS domain-containing protein [Opitutaceae bacterium]